MGRVGEHDHMIVRCGENRREETAKSLVGAEKTDSRFHTRDSIADPAHLTHSMIWVRRWHDPCLVDEDGRGGGAQKRRLRSFDHEEWRFMRSRILLKCQSWLITMACRTPLTSSHRAAKRALVSVSGRSTRGMMSCRELSGMRRLRIERANLFSASVPRTRIVSVYPDSTSRAAYSIRSPPPPAKTTISWTDVGGSEMSRKRASVSPTAAESKVHRGVTMRPRAVSIVRCLIIILNVQTRIVP